MSQDYLSMLKYISKCGVFSVILFNMKRPFRFPALLTLAGFGPILF